MYRRLLLLGLLRQREMHGYRLNEFIDRFLQVCSDLKRSTAYYLLDKLCREGFVTESSVREGHYPERKVYAITPAGEEYFQGLLRANLAGFERVTSPGDIGLAFAHELPREERRALLEERQRTVSEELQMLRRVPPHGGSLDLVIARNVAMLEAEMNWLDENIDGITKASRLHGFEDGSHGGLEEMRMKR